MVITALVVFPDDYNKSLALQFLPPNEKPYSPLKTGFLFSLNAVKASILSLVGITFKEEGVKGTCSYIDQMQGIFGLGCS